MALVSMAIQEERESYEDCPYGYGLGIRLNPGQCAALGINTPPPAGTVMMLVARAVANRVTQEADEGQAETEVYLELQITDLEVSGVQPTKSAAESLYGGDND